MEEKYINSIPGTKEFIFYTFFAAYLNQDIDSFEEGLEEFEETVPQEYKKLFAEAIDEFLNLNYPEFEKASFIEKLSSGWIDSKTFKEELISIRDNFNK